MVQSNKKSDIRMVYGLFDMFMIAVNSEIQKKRYNLLFEIMAAYEMIRKPLYDVHYITKFVRTHMTGFD